MIWQRRLLFLMALLMLQGLASGCGPKKLYLMDGRIFTPSEIHDDGDRIEFIVMRRTYNMPRKFRVDKSFGEGVPVLKIRISATAIAIPGRVTDSFEALYEYIDEELGARSLIIEIVEPHKWPVKRRNEFTRAHGLPWRRINVGLEGEWIGDFEELELDENVEDY